MRCLFTAGRLDYMYSPALSETMLEWAIYTIIYKRAYTAKIPFQKCFISIFILFTWEPTSCSMYLQDNCVVYLFIYLFNALQIHRLWGTKLTGLKYSDRVAKSSRSTRRKTNDATTTREDFTGTNIVQIRPACNPPSTNAIALKL